MANSLPDVRATKTEYSRIHLQFYNRNNQMGSCSNKTLDFILGEVSASNLDPQ
jgi:hypothetical protein